jgi:peptidyl-dipeptidase Dcp
VDTANPLVAPWSGSYGGVPPWDHLRPEHFPDAFGIALAEQRAEIDALTANPDPPDFENTVVALVLTSRTLDRVVRLFSVARERDDAPVPVSRT